jgi:hypothetical protein
MRIMTAQAHFLTGGVHMPTSADLQAIRAAIRQKIPAP